MLQLLIFLLLFWPFLFWFFQLAKLTIFHEETRGLVSGAIRGRGPLVFTKIVQARQNLKYYLHTKFRKNRLGTFCPCYMRTDGHGFLTHLYKFVLTPQNWKYNLHTKFRKNRLGSFFPVTYGWTDELYLRNLKKKLAPGAERLTRFTERVKKTPNLKTRSKILKL